MTTIAELIEKLREFPQDARVIVNGYEGGYEDVTGVNAIPIKLNVHTEDYYGPHDDPERGDADETAILIS
jgi:hypothetical protein